MAVSIAAVMRRVRNFFERERIEGTFTITGGMLEPMPDAPYIAVSGSAWHDGVWSRKLLTGELADGDEIHQMVQSALAEHDETFDGKVWGLHPPDDFLEICEDISNYDAKNPIGAYQSESFGQYSYTRPTISGAGIGWEAAFGMQLAPYRRMFTEVDV